MVDPTNDPPKADAATASDLLGALNINNRRQQILTFYTTILTVVAVAATAMLLIYMKYSVWYTIRTIKHKTNAVRSLEPPKAVPNHSSCASEILEIKLRVESRISMLCNFKTL